MPSEYQKLLDTQADIQAKLMAVKISVSIPAVLWNRVCTIAADSGESRSAVITDLLDVALG